MPMMWVEPEKYFEYDGRTIYHTYRNDNFSERRVYGFTTDVNEDVKYEFDIRDLETYSDNKDANEIGRKLILAEAIDKGHMKYPDDIDSDNDGEDSIKFGDSEFRCECGNMAEYDGFDTCDEKGEPMEPIPFDWSGHYKCNRCAKIYKLQDEE